MAKKGQKHKQWATKHTYRKLKIEKLTRTPLKTGVASCAPER